jgi:hypothetical protein
MKGKWFQAEGWQGFVVSQSGDVCLVQHFDGCGQTAFLGLVHVDDMQGWKFYQTDQEMFDGH